MNSSEITFKYFKYPHHFSKHQTQPETCGICGLSLSGYRGSFIGEIELEFVCEDCLVLGKSADKEVYTNQGNIEELRKQLKGLQPELTHKELTVLVAARNTELEQRTPAPVTWQDFLWPVHCGNYCCYIKEVGKADLNDLAEGGDGQAFFENNLTDADTDAEEVWEAIRPDSPPNATLAYSVGVYLFQCLYCAEYLILWACD